MSVSVPSCLRGRVLPLKPPWSSFPREARPGAQLKPAQVFRACAPKSRGGSFRLAPVVLLRSGEKQSSGGNRARKEWLR